MRRAHHALWLVHLVLPLWWWWQAGALAIGRRTGDLVSHIWCIWNGGLGDPTRTAMSNWPNGIDLLPIMAGWGHIFVGTAAHRWAGLGFIPAYNLALSLYFVLAGVGGHALSRALGVSRPAAVIGGLLLQLDGYLLYNASDGRPEHAGLGILALALAGAVSTWRGRPEGQRTRAFELALPIATGLAGAAACVVSWEAGLWLAATMIWLAPFFWWSGRSPGAVRRWAIAAASTALFAAPWVGLFLARSVGSRAVDEGQFTVTWAMDQSTALLPFLLRAGRHPARALYPLLLLPWLSRERRLWLGVGSGLLLSLLFALGPAPGLWRSGDLFTDPAGHAYLWGPWQWFTHVPVLSWFHSPARVTMGWGIAVAVAGALALDALARRAGRLGPALAALLAVAMLGAAGWDLAVSGNWPRGGFKPPPFGAVHKLHRLGAPGAVLDLPRVSEGWQAEQTMVFQLIHQHPVVGHSWMRHMAPDGTPALVQAHPWLAWPAQEPPTTTEPGPPPSHEELRALADEGVRYLALFPRHLPASRREPVKRWLIATLGEPTWRQKDLWLCWDLLSVRLDP